MEGIQAQHKCARLEYDPVKDTEQVSINNIRSVCFALNFFANEGFVSFSNIYRLEKKIKYRAYKHSVNPYNHFPNSKEFPFSLESGSTPAKIESVHKAASSALSKDSGLSVTFDRFILSQGRQDISSKIIDISICIESLFPSGSEISYKFSLFGSFTGADAEKRKEAFSLLKSLYSARSKIVHGSSDPEKAIGKIRDDWGKVISIAKISILHKLNFLRENDKKDWDGYLTDLILQAKGQDDAA